MQFTKPGIEAQSTLGFEDVKVLIVGDLMLDIYIEGNVSRVSPEAPVAVLHQQHIRRVPGGAANVASNVAALGGRARLIGVIGDDGHAADLRNELTRWPTIDSSSMVVAGDRPTTTKTRVMSGNHQFVRIDNEVKSALSPATREKMLTEIEQGMEWADILLISDYDKGVCTRELVAGAIAIARRFKKPSIVDPKQRDFTIYAGATVIKPNRAELSAATGMTVQTDEECSVAARRIIDLTGSSIILTRSENGMSYFPVEGPAVHLPTFAKEVFDVSGAGDTVAATLALGFGSKLPVAFSMRCANHAASVVVSKLGTATVSRAELAAALDLEDHAIRKERGSLCTLAEAVRMREIWRQMELTVGFTNGCFDLLHPGHVAILEESAAQCDRLIVALNTDASVRRLKGETRPVQSELARARVMGALECVDMVILFEEDTPLEVIQALKPDLLVKGSDYTVDKVVGSDFVHSYGGRVALVNLVEGHSTTRLVQRASTPST
jgi:D-beta-D-heptose 7-phosphate kinase/D-beta-D-heptose 1-phosphate adenosyltransferase